MYSIADEPELSSNPFPRFAGFRGIEPIHIGSRRKVHPAERSREVAMMA